MLVLALPLRFFGLTESEGEQFPTLILEPQQTVNSNNQLFLMVGISDRLTDKDSLGVRSPPIRYRYFPRTYAS